MASAEIALQTLRSMADALRAAVDATGPEAAENFVTWDAVTGAATRGLRPILIAGHARGGRTARAEFRKADPPELVAAEEWALLHAGERARQLTEVSRAAIRQRIAQGIARGESPLAMARGIRDAIGLDQRGAAQIDALRQTLDTARVPEIRATAAIERRRGALLRQRAEMIARTETIAARNEGVMSAWRDMRADGTVSQSARKRWIAGGPGVCLTCLQLAAQAPIGLDDVWRTQFGMLMRPPAHPSCRCALALVQT